LVALQLEIAAAQANGDNILYFSLYGDKVFPYLQCITHAHSAPSGGQLPPRQRFEVLAMNSLRTSAEWPYGDITVLFQTMHSKHHKKYFLSTGLLNTMLHQQFRVVFFLFNCCICLNGNNFTNYLICLLLL
jgi:hypothetical protein